MSRHHISPPLLDASRGGDALTEIDASTTSREWKSR